MRFQAIAVVKSPQQPQEAAAVNLRGWADELEWPDAPSGDLRPPSVARAPRARRSAWAGDLPARARRRRSRRAAVGGAAQVRACGRSRHADRCGAATRCRAASAPSSPSRRIAAHVAGERSPIVADEEALPFRDASLDLVVSALALQFVNDLPGTLIQIRRALKPDGLFLAAHDRRREPRRVARGLCRRPRPKSRAACRRASRRSPICAISARCCSARASRCR